MPGVVERKRAAHENVAAEQNIVNRPRGLKLQTGNVLEHAHRSSDNSGRRLHHANRKADAENILVRRRDMRRRNHIHLGDRREAEIGDDLWGHASSSRAGVEQRHVYRECRRRHAGGRRSSELRCVLAVFEDRDLR